MSHITITIHTQDINQVYEAIDTLQRLLPAQADKECCRCVETPKVDPYEYKPESFPGAHDDSLTFPAVDPADVFGLPAVPHIAVEPPMPPAPPVPPGSQVGTAPYVNPCEPNNQQLQGMPPAPPTPPVVTPPTIISGVKLDGEGLPWDGRIHASTKTMRVSDNTWKLLKGVDKALIEKVKGELRVAMGQVGMIPPGTSVQASGETFVAQPGGIMPVPPVVVVIPPTPPALTLVPPLPPADDKGWPDSGPSPARPASPLAPPAADPYPDFVQFCTSNQQSGRLQYQQIVDTCGKYGITQLPMLNARHDLIPTIRAELESLCKP